MGLGYGVRLPLMDFTKKSNGVLIPFSDPFFATDAGYVIYLFLKLAYH